MIFQLFLTLNKRGCKKKKCTGTYSMKMMNFKNAGRISTGDKLKDGQQPYTL